MSHRSHSHIHGSRHIFHPEIKWCMQMVPSPTPSWQPVAYSMAAYLVPCNFFCVIMVSSTLSEVLCLFCSPTDLPRYRILNGLRLLSLNSLCTVRYFWISVIPAIRLYPPLLATNCPQRNFGFLQLIGSCWGNDFGRLINFFRQLLWVILFNLLFEKTFSRWCNWIFSRKPCQQHFHGGHDFCADATVVWFADFYSYLSLVHLLRSSVLEF